MMRESGLPTLTVSALARDLARGPASFRGRLVRVCRGRLSQGQPAERRSWSFAAVGDPFPHGASILVRSCAEGGPSLDPQGCLQGRIARPDGSVLEPAADEPVAVSDLIESRVWYLHVDCGAPRRTKTADPKARRF